MGGFRIKIVWVGAYETLHALVFGGKQSLVWIDLDSCCPVGVPGGGSAALLMAGRIMGVVQERPLGGWFGPRVHACTVVLCNLFC
jgi:hypothetical protein